MLLKDDPKVDYNNLALAPQINGVKQQLESG
jgi:hypothetical protein